MSEQLPNFEHLLKQRETVLEEKAEAQKVVSGLDAEYRELTKLLSQKCLYDGHDWKQDSVSYGAGHYWSCKVCHSAAPGRHYDRPDSWFNIPRNKRKRRPGKQMRVRVYRHGEVRYLGESN